MTARKPRALKMIAGTDQPCRRDDGDPLFVEDPLDEVPAAPDWLPNAHAVREWDRVAKILWAAKLLTPSSVQSLGILCACYGRIVQQYAAGSAPTASDLAQYRGFATEFGLTPMSQGKMKTGAPAEKANRFSSYGKRPDGKS